MKFISVICVLFIASVVAEDVPSLAESCDPEICQLPDCRCSSTNIPGNLEPKDTPQFVLVTFDDNVNVINVETYRRILNNRRNSNGCPASATFFVNHEYNNYLLVNELYNNGHEIALHSISHKTNQAYWQQASYQEMLREFGDQKIQMAHFANIPADTIQGIRIPFLQMTGNSSFQAIVSSDLTYDCTWPTVNHIDPGLWPYTLDYASIQECIIPPCPTASIPGAWVLPMISWIDLNGTPCFMVDSCYYVPPHDDEDAWFAFIMQNFERHYMGNRAPFGFYIHEWYLNVYPAVRNALNRFMNTVNNLPDAFMVGGNDVIQWVKNPIPVNEYKAQPCKKQVVTNCTARTCAVNSEHNGMTYWMPICNSCPAVYPWLGNPLGK